MRSPPTASPKGSPVAAWERGRLARLTAPATPAWERGRLARLVAPSSTGRAGWKPALPGGGTYAARLGHAIRLLAITLALAACNAGAYPIDVFPEMHYAPAYRRLEPDRLAPPPGAVPITGGKPAYTFDQASGLTNPAPATPAGLAAARASYGVNCAMCHGPDGHGNSPVASFFRGAGAVPPVDLASARVQGRSDGQLYWLITNGIGNMPPFHDLLTEQEVWSLVRYVRSVQAP